MANINDSIIDAFLGVPEFQNGVRSMKAIVEMSRVPPTQHSYQVACLPSREQMLIHVDASEFFRHIVDNVNSTIGMENGLQPSKPIDSRNLALMCRLVETQGRGTLLEEFFDRRDRRIMLAFCNRATDELRNILVNLNFYQISNRGDGSGYSEIWTIDTKTGLRETKSKVENALQEVEKNLLFNGISSEKKSLGSWFEEDGALRFKSDEVSKIMIGSRSSANERS
ncbi:MAG TPA: hypothetical protein VM260_27255 [Pirellula sp.]|nr:hypothetical protein [Pirellula sp.]